MSEADHLIKQLRQYSDISNHNELSENGWMMILMMYLLLLLSIVIEIRFY
jgi:hypothetical protein